MNGESSENVAGAVAPAAMPENVDLGRIRNSASWFFWIAALSIVNSVIAHTGGDWGFLVGLGVTQFADAFLSDAGSTGRQTALGFDFLAAGACVVLGLLARKPLLWPFGVGMALYVLDALLLVWVKDWVGVGFHAFVLYQLSVGLRLLLGAKGAQ